MAKSIKELDQYCRLNNRVLRKKEYRFNGVKVEQWIVDNSDDYGSKAHP